MTNRALIERAAKAAGIIIKPNDAPIHDNLTILYWLIQDPFRGWMPYDPINDDGDALRLAVKLGLTVDVRPLAVCIWRGRKQFPSFGMTEGDNDLCPATRRAIVRAAAALLPVDELNKERK